MKKLEEFVNEELILEFFLSMLDDYKISIDMIPHGEERQTRNNRPFIPKNEIVYSIGKVAKDIREDFDIELIKFNDRIKVEDYSRNNHLHILCDIQKDNKYSDWIRLVIVTEMEQKNMSTYDIKKTYKTYSPDNKIKKDIKLFKNMI